MDRKEAIDVIKKNYPHVTSSGSQFETALRTLIPELIDKDERIRKELIDFCKARSGQYSIFARNESQWNRWLDWLEKQGKTTDVDPVFSYNNLVTEKQASPVLSNSSNVGKDELNPCLNCTNEETPPLAWNENDEVALDSAATNYAQDKYLPVQTSQAFKAGARWVLTSLTTSSPTGQAPT